MLVQLLTCCTYSRFSHYFSLADAHHHLWDHVPGGRLEGLFDQKVYLLHDMLEDIAGSGHNVTSSVYVQAYSFHSLLSDTPPEEEPIGEVEYCQGVAALCDSGVYGTTRINAAIVGSCNLAHPRAEIVLKKMMGLRNFRGIRNRPHGELNDDFRRGLASLQKLGLSYDFYSSDWRKIEMLTQIAQVSSC